MTNDDHLVQETAARLIDWCAAVRRPLPWRLSPTPYHVWVSEIMLQQTRIEAVIPYYARFLDTLPDIPSLAAVEEDKLLKLWEGLGYYSRARNLQKAAKRVMTDYGGELPREAAKLKTLPGIGDYTAGAIASIAYGEPEPAVDGNVLRVMMRVLACPDDIMRSGTRAGITSLLREHYPHGERAGLLTEGIMELGETVCLPNAAPKCEACPLNTICRACLKGETDRYPVRTPPRERRIEQRTVLLLCCGGRYAVRKREGKGLLAGLWEFPNLGGALDEAEALDAVHALGGKAVGIEPCGEAKHVFTHVEWHMRGYRIALAEELRGFLWKTPEEIKADCPIPTALRYYQKRL
ncbi:MAG: A/G-specific adenine glycosylase [Oscillospiraceae bacterium]|nr:A/G-specific adenine glycosylase [Oscillospiraceae bacterium]MBQ6927377.1 A/G-specific adenine glycosylase [Oscillospiraceae bacterium]